MLKLSKVALAVLLMACAGCGSSSGPAAVPTTPTAVTWTLSGTVTTSSGAAISGAIATILDGPDANKSTTTNTAGRYTFELLKQAGFTLRVAATGYTDVTKPVNLTGNTALDFQLPRLPVANLVVEGALVFDAPNQDGSRGLHGTALNNGDSCASSIAGMTTLSSTADPNVKVSLSWNLPASVILRPGERVNYPMCCVTAEQLRLFGPEGTYNTQFSFVTVACQ